MKKDFSLIIPVAPDRGAEVLNSIAKLDYPKSKYEVIVERGTNPSRNRNNGAKKAKGEILCFLDDDAIVPKNLLKNAEFHFGRCQDASIIGGPQLTPTDDSYFAKASGKAFSSFFVTAGMSNRYKKGKPNYSADESSLTSAIMFVNSSDFRKIGGFDASLWPGEDIKFVSDAKRLGMKVIYHPDIYIFHRRRPTLFGLIKQFFSYGKTRIEKQSKEGKKPGLLFFAPMFFALYIISLIFVQDIYYFLPLIAYSLIAFITALWISLEDIYKEEGMPFEYLFILPFLFFAIHMAYGLGITEAILGRIFPEEKINELRVALR